MKCSRVAWLLAVALLVVAHMPALSAVFKITINRMTVPQPTRAVVRNGQLMMPLRSLPELVGFIVTWEQDTHTAVATAKDMEVYPGTDRKTIEVRMTIGSKTATVNGQPVELPAPAELINDTAYVPVPFLATTFGGGVEWEAVDTGVVDVLVNGEFYPFDFGTIIRNEHVMVPIARVSERLFKASLIRHEPEQAVFASSPKGYLRANIDSAEAYANGEKVTLSAAPQLIDDLVYVPLKFLVEAFGGTVQWDADTRTLDILAEVEPVGGAAATVSFD